MLAGSAAVRCPSSMIEPARRIYRTRRSEFEFYLGRAMLLAPPIMVLTLINGHPSLVGAAALLVLAAAAEAWFWWMNKRSERLGVIVTCDAVVVQNFLRDVHVPIQTIVDVQLRPVRGQANVCVVVVDDGSMIRVGGIEARNALRGYDTTEADAVLSELWQAIAAAQVAKS
jgi:hypothetical protein